MTDIFTIKQNDTSPALRYTLDPPVDLTGATAVFSLRARVGGATKLDKAPAAIVAPATDGVVQYDWAPGDTDTAGPFQGEFQVTYADSSVETYPNDSYLNIKITGEIA